MFYKKIITAFLFLVVTITATASENVNDRTNRLEKKVAELESILYSHKQGWSNPVISSPYFGLRSSFDGSDLITNLPSINEDMRLLQHKYLFHNTFRKHNLKIPAEPVIELSGKLESIALTRNPYVGKIDNQIDMATVELDFTVHAHQWVTGFMAINYDNSPTFLNRNRAANSRFFLNKGFITIGDFTQSPFYASIGQMFVPFGRYTSGMVSSTFPSQLARSRVRAMNFGFRHPMGFYGQIYGFNGALDTHELSGGLNVGMEGYFNGHIKGNMAMGLISDIAESDGMQNNGNVVVTPENPTVFAGFGRHAVTDVHALEHAVPAVNAHANFTIGDWTLIGEYVSALRRFDQRDLMVNNHGAEPYAFQIEGVYGFEFYNFSSHLALSYQQAHDTLPLLIPEHRYSATLSTSIWRNTIQALEFRHDSMYSNNDRAFGRVMSNRAAGTGNSTVLNVMSGGANLAGKTSNMLVAQMGLYF